MRWSWQASIAGAALIFATAAPGSAQQFTTAAEVRPILAATQANWIAVRDYEGQDLLYFTHLLAWRCGLAGIRYAVNGGAPQPFVMEPCHEGTAQPNAILAEDLPIYAVYPQGSIATVSVTISYDDGASETVEFARSSVLMP